VYKPGVHENDTESGSTGSALHSLKNDHPETADCFVEHIELPGKLPDYFLRRNKSNNQPMKNNWTGRRLQNLISQSQVHADFKSADSTRSSSRCLFLSQVNIAMGKPSQSFLKKKYMYEGRTSATYEGRTRYEVFLEFRFLRRI